MALHVKQSKMVHPTGAVQTPRRTRIFIGRPDGIGNRVEELIKLGAVAAESSDTIHYLWNNINPSRDRRYPTLLQHALVPIFSIPSWSCLATRVSCAFSRRVARVVNRSLNARMNTCLLSSIQRSAAQLTPLFSISFEAHDVLGVHIRSTDRLNALSHRGYTDHFMTDDEFRFFYVTALEYAKSHRLKSVFVCADSPEIEVKAERELATAGKEPARPRVDASIPPEYRDFFALSLCREIVLAAKYSSFSLTAAQVGNVPVKTFGTSAELLERHRVTSADMADDDD